MTTFLLRL